MESCKEGVQVFLRDYISCNMLLRKSWTRHAICYQGKVGPDRVLDIHGFVDVDWVGDIDHGRYTSGYVFNLFGGSISWMSKKQVVVEL